MPCIIVLSSGLRIRAMNPPGFKRVIRPYFGTLRPGLTSIIPTRSHRAPPKRPELDCATAMIFDRGVLISEIFYSIQGEGELTGVPSVFIRTSGCNLRCNWCDTMYASWNPEGEDLPIKGILTKVDALPHAQHVVLTGGEPMIARDIRTLARELRERRKHITIETAATVAPEGIECDLASLSPKLSNSTPDERLPATWRERHEQTRLQPLVIRKWIEQYNYQLKFVVSSADDLQEIQALLPKIGTEIPPSKVLLMPEGVTTEVIRGRDETLIEICKKTGYRYCNRLHVELFGHTRGT